MSSIIKDADLTAYMLGKATDTALVTSVTKAVNQWVESRTHRCWGDQVAVTDEQYRWANVIWLRHTDVKTITSVKLGFPGQTQTTVDSNAYYLNPLGRVSFYGWWANNNMSSIYNDYLHISYVHGVDEVPDDLKLAALGIAAGFYNWAAAGQKEVVSAQVGSYHLEYSGRFKGGTGGDAAMNTADANYAVIDSYRMRRA